MLLKTHADVENTCARWVCYDCDRYTDWSYWELIDCGIPVCPVCDSEMDIHIDG